MFGKVRTRTLAIIVAIAIIAVIVIRSCYVCEGFVEGSFTREEAKKYFTPGSQRGSEKEYIANKVYGIHANSALSPILEKNLKKKNDKGQNETDWEAIDKIWQDIMGQPDTDASKTRLFQIAEQYGVKKEDLGLYAKSDIVDIYAMKAYDLQVEYDENGVPRDYDYSYKILNEMYSDVQKSTSVEEAKQKYEKYAKKYPPKDYGNEDHHGEGEDHHGEGEDHHGEDKGCYEKVCDTGYNSRFKGMFKVGSTMDGHAIFLLEELEPKIVQTLKGQGQTISDDFNIMREVVHNWMFETEVNGASSRFSPLMKCYHYFGNENGKDTMNLKTFPASPFAQGFGEERLVSWYQCGGPSAAPPPPPPPPPADGPPEGEVFAPHDQVGSILDTETIIDPPGIMGPSSLTPPDTRPVNIIITSNVGPYGQVTNTPKPHQPVTTYNHELGEKTNKEINKTMTFMEHVMTESQKK